MINTVLLHERIASRADDFIRELYGDAARRAGTGWRVNRRGSLAVGVVNGKVLVSDFESGGGGDAVALWQRERGGTLGEALHACAKWSGINNDEPAAVRVASAARTRKVERSQIPCTPARVLDAWLEGREWLVGNGTALDAIGSWREWPRQYIETLAGAGIITAPRCCGERARIAFPVATPVTWPTGDDLPPDNAHRDRGRFIGFHARMFDSQGERRGWRYAPKRSEGTFAHPGLPPLPLVLSSAGGLGQVWSARLMIICEGEFDVCTLPLALGWFDNELHVLRIPPTVALVGIAGASGGPGELLDAYRFCWPRELRVLVLRDSDRAGAKWVAPGGFLDSLRARCAEVASCHFGANRDGSRRDVNDAFAAGVLTRELLDAALQQRLGTSLAEAESTPPPAPSVQHLSAV